MTPALHYQFAALPRLEALHAAAFARPCKICGSQAALFDVVDFLKHCSFDQQYAHGLSGIEVPYLRCEACGFLFTSFFDEWQQDDWRKFVYNDDYVRVDPEYTGARSARLAQTLANLLQGCEKMRILDYGAGAGGFTTHMNAAGFASVTAYDPFSCPSRPDGDYDIVTCLEALEHTADPRAAMADMQTLLAPGGCVIFSQSVQPADIQAIRGAWWYIAPRNGHISTFTVETLCQLLPSRAHALHGNGWLWAIAPPAPARALQEAIPRIGPAIVTCTLAAPAMGQDDQWHPVESGGGKSFRWSRATRLDVSIPEGSRLPAHLYLRVPYMLEVREGFASACRISVGGVRANVCVTRSAIVADARLDAGSSCPVVTIETPEPCSPLALRGVADARHLGLAVPVG
jgi:2-polyprenyl-6-hydroxyphenyl methylase/3-demethylubiquinone-9 3-methyltransferase